MTCIAAIADGETVWMGGDRAATTGNTLDGYSTPKVFISCGRIIIGAAGDLRLLQIMEHAFIPPKHDGDSLGYYMAVKFMDELRKCVKAGGLMEYHDGREKMDGQLLVGIQGALFYISPWLSFIQNAYGYDAIGCGQDIAKGILFATKDYGIVPYLGHRYPIAPSDRLTFALEAAEFHCAGVRGPFDILTLGKTER